MFQELLAGYTRYFSLTLFRCYFLIKGVVGSILMYGSLPLFRWSYAVSGLQYQKYVTIGMAPWSMKPLMGAISDTYPIYGHNKRYYVLAAACIGSISVGAIAANVSSGVAALFLCMTSFCIMTIDLLFEGAYSRILAYGNGSTGIASYVWGCVMAGSVIGAIIVGPLGDTGHIKIAFILCVPLFIQMIQPLCTNPNAAIPGDKTYLHGTEQLMEDEHERNHPSRDKNEENPDEYSAAAHKKILPPPIPLKPGDWSLCILMFIGTIILLIALFASKTHPWTVFAVGFTVCLILHSWAYAVYSITGNKTLWVCNLYMFLCEATYIDISGASDYWYTATPECVNDGPHFDLIIYTTTASILGGIIGVIMAAVYAAWFSNWKLRNIIQMAAIFRCASTFTDVLIAKRWNQTHLGLSDKATFILGDAIISPAASMLVLLPMVLLTSKLVTRGQESTTYAILAGFQNLGQTMSRITGVALIHSFKIHTEPPNCNFDGYPALIIFSHMAFPLIAIPLAFIMIPDQAISRNKPKHVE